MIDGLDEYEGNDRDRLEIITLFKTIASFEHVKLCLSSRPWLIFEDAFKSYPYVRLQELTFNDIRHYVYAKIGENPQYKQYLAKQPAECAT